jgi:Flp pilus assembly protein TadG
MKRPNVRSSRRGVSTVELALVMPVLVLMLFGIIEFGTMFFVHHKMVLAARDAARFVAVRGHTPAQAEALALSQLADIGATFDVTVSEIPTLPAGETDVSVAIEVPQDQIAFGIASSLLGNGMLRSEVTMRKEYQ